MGAPHLTIRQNEKLRAEVRAIIATEYKGNASEFAHAIGRSQPVVSDFLSGKSGASWDTVKRIARKHRRTDESLVGPDDTTPTPDVERDAAIQAAQLLRMDRSAIARVLRENHEVTGKPRRWWFVQFQAEDQAQPASTRRRARVAR